MRSAVRLPTPGPELNGPVDGAPLSTRYTKCQDQFLKSRAFRAVGGINIQNGMECF